MKLSEQQQAIVQAALELLASGGPQALRVREIAEAAGCTTMTVYSRFGGKDGVVEAIYLDGFERFTEALAVEAHGPVVERVNRMSLAYRSWALANPGSYQVMFTEAVPGFKPSDSAAFVALGSFQVLVDMVTELQSGGHVHGEDPLNTAWAFWGMAHGMVMLELAAMKPAETPGGAQAIYENAMQALLKGLAS